MKNYHPYELDIKLSVNQPIGLEIEIAEDLMDQSGVPADRQTILDKAAFYLDQAVCRFIAADPLLKAADALEPDWPHIFLEVSFITMSDDDEYDVLTHAFHLIEHCNPGTEGVILRELKTRCLARLTGLLTTLEVA